MWREASTSATIPAVTDARASRRSYRLHMLDDQNPEQSTEVLVDVPSRIYIMSES